MLDGVKGRSKPVGSCWPLSKPKPFLHNLYRVLQCFQWRKFKGSWFNAKNTCSMQRIMVHGKGSWFKGKDHGSMQGSSKDHGSWQKDHGKSKYDPSFKRFLNLPIVNRTIKEIGVRDSIVGFNKNKHHIREIIQLPPITPARCKRK